jgi:membrane protein
LPKKTPILRRRYLFVFVARAVRTVKRLLRAEAMVYAGYLSFLTMLALAPALAVAYWMAEQSSLAGIADKALREYLTTHLFPDSAQEVVRTITSLRLNARQLGVTALVALAVDLIFKAYAIHSAFERIQEHAVRWWLPLRVLVVVLIVVPLTVAATIWGVQTLAHGVTYLFSAMRNSIEWFFAPFHVSLPLWAGLIVLYLGCLTKAGSLRRVALVSAMVALAIEALRFYLAGYFSNLAQVRSLYGTFSAFPVIMLSLFSTWLLVLVGAAWLCERGTHAKPVQRA